jgi:hypothetical protein
MNFSKGGRRDSAEATLAVVAVGSAADTAGLSLATPGIELNQRGVVKVENTCGHQRTTSSTPATAPPASCFSRRLSRTASWRRPTPCGGRRCLSGSAEQSLYGGDRKVSPASAPAGSKRVLARRNPRLLWMAVQRGLRSMLCRHDALPRHQRPAAARAAYADWAGYRTERSAKGIIIVAVLLVLAATPAVSATDRRLGWSSAPPVVVVLGELLIVPAHIGFCLVFSANIYGVATIQVAQGQNIISTGLCTVIPHPHVCLEPSDGLGDSTGPGLMVGDAYGGAYDCRACGKDTER